MAIKAIGLLSGGLDSALATRLMVDQGIEVLAVKFTSVFCQCDQGGCCHATKIAQQMGIPLRLMAKGEDYIDLLRHPHHGYGSGMNPCIDCRIYMLRKTKTLLQEIGASFIFTGEVLGQRPMSQHRRALDLIERESGLQGKILRPLSAQQLPPTEAETQGWVNRDRLLRIAGRGRRTQLDLARALDLRDHACPAGGCLLTDKAYAARLRDLFAHRTQVTIPDLALLKTGRHFRSGSHKIIAGRNQRENDLLRRAAAPDDLLLEVRHCGSPVVILQGPLGTTPDDLAALRLAAMVAAAYSDATDPEVTVAYGEGATARTLQVPRDRVALQAHGLGL